MDSDIFREERRQSEHSGGFVRDVSCIGPIDIDPIEEPEDVSTFDDEEENRYVKYDEYLQDDDEIFVVDD